MTRTQLVQFIRSQHSFLCVGLDPDLVKLPDPISKNPEGVLEFCTAIIEATHEYCVAYKLNTAFFEALGPAGWEALAKTIDRIPSSHFIIADAKRGDIGNTSRQYAKAFFEALPCDALTVAPYMGHDSVKPFLEFEGKWTILLGLTSNAGSQDFQQLLTEGKPLYESVLQKAADWGSPEQLMFVVGATHPESFDRIREIVPDHFLLVPGVGAQGGSLDEVCKYGVNEDVGLLVNASRSIIYAGSGKDFPERAGEEAFNIQSAMSKFL